VATATNSTTPMARRASKNKLERWRRMRSRSGG
jgi:hypothetical protein